MLKTLTTRHRYELYYTTIKRDMITESIKTKVEKHSQSLVKFSQCILTKKIKNINKNTMKTLNIVQVRRKSKCLELIELTPTVNQMN